MRKHREVYLLILLTLAGCALSLGFFLLQNRKTSVSYADLFSPGKEITHTELTPSVPAGPLVNINTATAEQLQTLPGIGPGLAQKILDYRAEHGPFATVAELSKVPGIGINRLEDLLGHITTGG